MIVFALLICVFTGLTFAMEIKYKDELVDEWVEVAFKNIPGEKTSLVKNNKKDLNIFQQTRVINRSDINKRVESIYYVDDKKNDMSCFYIFKILFCCDKN